MKDFFRRIKEKLNIIEGFINDYAGNSKNIANPAQSYVEWATRLLSEGKEDIALEKLETVTEMAIKSPDACINLAMAFIRHGKFEEVPKLLNSAIKIDSQCARAYLAYGIFYSAQMNFEKAEYYYEIASKLDPKQPDVYVNWAVALVSQGKLQDAQEKFKKALFYNPHNLVGLYLWSVLDIDMGNYKQAREKLAVVLSFQPKNPEALFSMAFAYYKEGDFELAIEFGKCALEVSQNNPQLYDFIADSYCKLNKYDDALSFYKIADKKDFKFEKIYLNWGNNAFINDDYENAYYAFKTAMKINPDSVNAKVGMASNYILRNELDEAEVLMKEIIDSDPENAYVYLNLARVERDLKKYKEAIKYYLYAIKMDVKYTCHYSDLGELYELTGEIQKAKDAYLTALEYGVEDYNVYYRYAKLFSDDNPKEALRKIRTAYNKNQKNKDYAKLYINLLLKNGQYKNALDLAEKNIIKPDESESQDEKKINEQDFEFVYLKIRALLCLKKFNESITLLYGLPQDKKDNEDFDYLLCWAYILRAGATKAQADINEMNDFSYYLSQKYGKNNKFMVKLKELEDKKVSED